MTKSEAYQYARDLAANAWKLAEYRGKRDRYERVARQREAIAAEIFESMVSAYDRNELRARLLGCL